MMGNKQKANEINTLRNLLISNARELQDRVGTLERTLLMSQNGPSELISESVLRIEEKISEITKKLLSDMTIEESQILLNLCRAHKNLKY